MLKCSNYKDIFCTWQIWLDDEWWLVTMIHLTCQVIVKLVGGGGKDSWNRGYLADMTNIFE